MIKTERLSLRPVQAGDWKAIKAIWTDQAGSVYAPYIKPKVLDDESVRRETAVWADFADSDEHFYFVVCHGQTVIGYIALHKRENGYETGYCFHSDYQGKGYAKESMRAVLDYMKAQGVTRIEAHTALKNAPSVKLLTSLGFIRTGTEEISFLRDQEGKDIIIEDGIFEMQLS